jgi:hypothetical protein
MNTDQLLDYIFEGRSSHFANAFKDWLTYPRFATFAEKYRQKIRKKIRGANSDEDLRDIHFELEIAYLLLKTEVFDTVEYEKHGSGPDFTATCQTGATLNVEVKRIRKADPETRLAEWEKTVAERIRSEPSSLSVVMNIAPLDPKPELLDRLERSTEDIVNYILSIIRKEKERDEIPVDETVQCPVPGFSGDEIEFMIGKPSTKASSVRTSYYGGIFPVFFTTREHYQVSDAILRKLHQMPPGEMNLLVITTDSTSHHQSDLTQAVESLCELIEKGDDRFFISRRFEGIADFVSQFRKLSCILFRSIWVGPEGRNHLFRNQNADRQIPAEICEILRRMD